VASDREDRWGGDEGRDRWEDERGRGRPSGGDPVAGRSKVKGPAVGLIAVGVITLLLTAYAGVTLATGDMAKQMDEAFAQQEEKMDKDPQMNAQQKQDAKQMVANMKKFTQGVMPVFVGLLGLSGLLVLIGGAKLWNLSGRGWPMFASILSMIPCCVSYTCVLGIPIGIWALVTLNNPDVKAAMAAKSAGGPDRGRLDDERERGV
jgi:hypothetical protein